MQKHTRTLRVLVSGFAALAVTAAALWTDHAAVADGAGDSETTYASLDDARVKDDLSGNLADASKEVRVGLYLTAGSTLSLTLAPASVEGAAPATGLGLTMCDAAGTDLQIAGSARDVSKGDGTIRWKKVKPATSGDYVLIVRGATPGGYRLVLTATAAKTTAADLDADVAPNQEFDVPFTGIARGSLSYTLAASGAKGFVGELVRIEQPDGSDLPMTPTASKGKVTLAQDGPHILWYKNAGSKTGDAKVSASVTPPKAVTRKGFLRPEGTAFAPVVKGLDPTSAFHKENALPLIVKGRDFQAGADVRLLRKGRTDILATSIDVRSETEIACVVNLDTTQSDEGQSVGTWTVGVYNAPVYTSEGDRTTLVKDSTTKSTSKTLTSLSNASIRLPSGIEKGAEVWHVDFNDAFQTDLDRMGFDSNDGVVQESARNAIEAYTILFLRDLFRVNETNGQVKKNVSVPICFIVEKPPEVAGAAGVDYNRIEVGGAWQSGDVRDVAEPLLWGYSPIDDGNATRNDLSVLDGDGNRVGAGARTRVLDPGNATAAQSWITAMQPLRTSPLTANDRKYFSPGFAPRSQSEADRYAVIVNQITRASREIAAIVAHHVGKAMGIPDEGTGPMANPDLAGAFWPFTASLNFADGDVVELISLAKAHELPGQTRDLNISYFPLLTTQAYLLPDLTTDVNYTATFNFVGGRPNATAESYRVFYAAGSEAPRGSFTLSFAGLSGKAPTMLAVNTFYCDIEYLRIGVEDVKRGTARAFLFRLNVLPNVPLVPAALQAQATSCRNQVLSTQ